MNHRARTGRPMTKLALILTVVVATNILWPMGYVTWLTSSV